MNDLRWKNKLVGYLSESAHDAAAGALRGGRSRTPAVWDELLAKGMRISAVGNSDAHGTPMQLGPIRREVYPASSLFRAVNPRLAAEPLNGDVEHDRALLTRAVGRGHSWVGYDMTAALTTRSATVQGEKRALWAMVIPRSHIADQRAVAVIERPRRSSWNRCGRSGARAIWLICPRAGHIEVECYLH